MKGLKKGRLVYWYIDRGRANKLAKEESMIRQRLSTRNFSYLAKLDGMWFPFKFTRMICGVYEMNARPLQLSVVVESDLACLGLSLPRKLQGVPRGVFLDQSVWALIKAWNLSGCLRCTVYQEEYFLDKISSDLVVGSWSCSSLFDPELYRFLVILERRWWHSILMQQPCHLRTLYCCYENC